MKDPMMPFTSLTESEKLSIDNILNTLSDDQWQKFLTNQNIELTRELFNVAFWAGEQWL